MIIYGYVVELLRDLSVLKKRFFKFTKAKKRGKKLHRVREHDHTMRVFRKLRQKISSIINSSQISNMCLNVSHFCGILPLHYIFNSFYGINLYILLTIIAVREFSLKLIFIDKIFNSIQIIILSQ